MRAEKHHAGGAKEQFYYDGASVIEETDGSQNLVREYVNGGQYIDEVILVANTVGASVIYNYYMTDLRYSDYGFIDSSGAVVERAKYDGFGKRTLLDASYATITTPNVNQCYGYTGIRHDNESGLQYYRARYFDNTLGRFINRDPLEYVDGLNLYQGYFVPNEVDPSGLKCDKISDVNPTRNYDCLRIQKKINIPGPQGVRIPLGPYGRFEINWKIEAELTSETCKRCCKCNDEKEYKRNRIRIRGGVAAVLSIGLNENFSIGPKNDPLWQISVFGGGKIEGWGSFVGSGSNENDPCNGMNNLGLIKICFGAQVRIRGSFGLTARYQMGRFYSLDLGAQIYAQITLDASSCAVFDSNGNFRNFEDNRTQWSDPSIFFEVCLGTCFRWQLL